MIIGLMCHLDSNKEGDGVDIPEVAHPKQDSHDATADHPSGQEVPKMDPLSHLSTTDTQRKPINVRNLLSTNLVSIISLTIIASNQNISHTEQTLSHPMT